MGSDQIVFFSMPNTAKSLSLVWLLTLGLFLLLGDASGHGIGPALSATQMTGMLRVSLRLGVG